MKIKHRLLDVHISKDVCTKLKCSQLPHLTLPVAFSVHWAPVTSPVFECTGVNVCTLHYFRPFWAASG